MYRIRDMFCDVMPFAGQDVITSGLYHAAHAGHSDQDGNVALIKGGRFPLCQKCEYGVHYTLVRAAPGQAELPDFNPPQRKAKPSGAD
jgi:hypothetical protein